MTPTTHSLDAEREQFEEWCRANHPTSPLGRELSDGEYDGLLATWTWGAWKASAELTRPQEVAAVGDVDVDRLVGRLRMACLNVRTKSAPLSDLIPLMQQAADELEAASRAPVVRAEPAPDEAAAHIQSVFRANCVHYAGNYEVTPGQAIRIAAKLYTAPPGADMKHYTVIMPWACSGDPTDEEGTYSDTFCAESAAEAELMCATAMADSGEKDLDGEGERQGYIDSLVAGWRDTVRDTRPELEAERDALLLELDALKNRPTRMHVLGMTDNGTAVDSFTSEADRVAFLAEQDDSFDDWYTLEVYADGTIDFCLAAIGQDALEDLRENHPDHPSLKGKK